jgi:hypothetical protein
VAAVRPLELAPVASLDEARRKRRSAFYVTGSVAAAAVVLLAVFASMNAAAPDEEMASSAPSDMAPANQSAPVEVMPAPSAAESAAEPMEETTAGEREGASLATGAAYAQDSTENDLAEAESVAEAPREMASPEAAAQPRARRTVSRATRGGGTNTIASASPTMANTDTTTTRVRASMSSTPTSTGAASGGGGGVPSRDEVVAALRAVQPQVSACRAARGGVVEVDITVSGSSGRVRNALVVGEFSGTREGSCVARAARNARFPTFSRESFHVRFPFQL